MENKKDKRNEKLKAKKEKLAEMCRLYEEENQSLRQIAERFGLTRQAIHQRLTRAGTRMRSNSPSRRTIERETLIRLYVNQEMTLGDVAKSLNKTRYAITQLPGKTRHRKTLYWLFETKVSGIISVKNRRKDGNPTPEGKAAVS